MSIARASSWCCLLVLGACSKPNAVLVPEDAGTSPDGGASTADASAVVPDSGVLADTGVSADAGAVDSGAIDGGGPVQDAGTSTGAWFQTPGPTGGSVRGLLYDPVGFRTVYAATAGGVFRSENDGLDWTAYSQGLATPGVQRLAIEGHSSATLYAMTDLRDLERNTGSGWDPAPGAGLAGHAVVALAVDPMAPNTMYAGTMFGAFKTTDGGVSWRSLFGGQDIQVLAVAIDPAVPSTIYLAFGGISKSTDDGATWTRIRTFPSSRPTTLTIDPAHPSTVYVGTAGDGLFLSEDGGQSWSEVLGAAPAADIRAVVIDPSARDTIFIAASDGLHKTSDRGAHWALLLREEVMDVAVDPVDSLFVVAASPRGLLRSTDGGSNFYAADRGLVASEVVCLAVDPASPSTLWAAAHQSLYRSTDGGDSWSWVDTGTVTALAFDPRAPGHVLAIHEGEGFFWTNDGGTTWGGIGSAASGLSTTRIAALAVLPTDPTHLLAAAEDGLFLTTDRGLSWSRVPELGMQGFDTIAVASRAPMTIFVGGFGAGVFRSSDGGAHWTAENDGLTDLNVTALAIDPSAPSTIYAETTTAIFKSTDAGAHWALSVGLPENFGGSIVIDPLATDNVFVATSAGITQTTDGGTHWSAPEILREVGVNVLAIDPVHPSTLYAGTRGSGVFKTLRGGRSAR
ncbi:MAG: YCF48-related protein [Myxococcota bacterium]